jgi:hypothetical protein
MEERLKEIGFEKVEKPAGYPTTYKLDVNENLKLDKPYSVYAEIAAMKATEGDSFNHTAIYAVFGEEESITVGITQGIGKSEEEMMTCLANFMEAN